MKKHFRASTFKRLVAGDRFFFASGGRKGMPATLVYKTKDLLCCYHFGHEYNEEARRFKSRYNVTVWVEVKP